MLLFSRPDNIGQRKRNNTTPFSTVLRLGPLFCGLPSHLCRNFPRGNMWGCLCTTGTRSGFATCWQTEKLCVGLGTRSSLSLLKGSVWYILPDWLGCLIQDLMAFQSLSTTRKNAEVEGSRKSSVCYKWETSGYVCKWKLLPLGAEQGVWVTRNSLMSTALWHGDVLKMSSDFN